MKTNYQKGQISLLVLLVAAVVTTLGISVSQKTVLETKIDTDEQALKQAFNSAESGIEYYLGSGKQAAGSKMTYTSPDGKSRAQIEVAPLGTTDEISFNTPVLAGDYEYFWLVAHNEDGSLNTAVSYQGPTVEICMDNDRSNMLEAVLFYLDGSGNYNVLRKMLNLDASGTAINGVSATGYSTCGGYPRGVTMDVNVTGTKVLLAVMPMAVSTNIKILSAAGATFPSQGSQITSVGEVGDLEGSPVRSRVAIQDRYKLLPFLLNPLVSARQVLSQ